MYADFRQFKEVAQRLKPESFVNRDSLYTYIGPERLANGAGLLLGGDHKLRAHALPALVLKHAKPTDSCGAVMF